MLRKSFPKAFQKLTRNIFGGEEERGLI